MTDQEPQAFANACDCLYYGYGRKHWNICGLTKEKADEIWEKAFEKMANGF